MKKKHKKIKQLKPKYKKILIFFIIILIILLGLIAKKVIKKYILEDNFNNTVETKPKDELEKYDYYLSRNATKYEEKLFKNLKKILSEETINEEEYATILSKLFISDLFTLNTKKSSSDITSSQYIHTDYQEIYKEQVKNTLYSNIEMNLDNTRTQKLPTVTSVEIVKVEKTNFEVKNESKDAYHVTVKIQYEQDLKYPTEYQIILVKNNELLQIAKVGKEI